MSLVTAYLLPHHGYGYSYYYEQPSLLQRILLIWCFVLCGLVICFQIAQSWAHPRPRWTVLDDKTKHYWYTFYVLEAFLTMQVAYRPLLWKLEGLWLSGGGGAKSGGGSGTGLDLGVEFLDALWILLLGLEIAMVAGVVVSRIARALGGSGGGGGGPVIVTAPPLGRKLKAL